MEDLVEVNEACLCKDPNVFDFQANVGLVRIDHACLEWDLESTEYISIQGKLNKVKKLNIYVRIASYIIQ